MTSLVGCCRLRSEDAEADSTGRGRAALPPLPDHTLFDCDFLFKSGFAE